MPNIYPVALLMTGETLSPNETPLVYIDYKSYMNLADIYLSLNARFYMQNATKYALRSEMFSQNEYNSIFVQAMAGSSSKQCHLGLFSKLVYLSQTEFNQIVLWSAEFSLTNANTTAFVSLNTRISQIDEVLSILSLKIQPQNT